MSEIKLSEAIRLGAMQLPPSRSGRVFDTVTDDIFDWRICGACAFGAAVYAIGFSWGMFSASDYGEAGERLPLLKRSVKHPVTGYVERVGHIMSGLYESHKWTREQIADWVESIERRAEAERQPQPEAVATAVRTA